LEGKLLVANRFTQTSVSETHLGVEIRLNSRFVDTINTRDGCNSAAVVGWIAKIRKEQEVSGFLLWGVTYHDLLHMTKPEATFVLEQSRLHLP